MSQTINSIKSCDYNAHHKPKAFKFILYSDLTKNIVSCKTLFLKFTWDTRKKVGPKLLRSDQGLY